MTKNTTIQPHYNNNSNKNNNIDRSKTVMEIECDRKHIAIYTLLLIVFLTILLSAISLVNKMLDQKYIKSARQLSLLLHAGNEEESALLEGHNDGIRTLRQRRGEASSRSLVNYHNLQDLVFTKMCSSSLMTAQQPSTTTINNND